MYLGNHQIAQSIFKGSVKCKEELASVNYFATFSNMSLPFNRSYVAIIDLTTDKESSSEPDDLPQAVVSKIPSTNER